MPLSLDIPAIRKQFPALERRHQGAPVAYFDGPAGSQVPLVVADAVHRHMLHVNANTHGLFASSLENDAVLDAARQAAADFLGAPVSTSVIWGPNMTTLTFALSRSLGRTWSAGDEVVVTQLDHDANVTPWVLAARDAGATVRVAPIRTADATLDLEAFAELLGPRTRLVAVTAASNATGTATPIARIAELVHAAGAELFVDAVHIAPHRSIDVDAWGCDFLACSPYKFFGPHMGMLWGRAERMRALPAYQVRPAGDELPGRFETGTQCHEGIAGTLAAIDYLAGLGGGGDDRRAALVAAYGAIESHERGLCAALLDGLAELDGYTVWGIAASSRMDERVPTVSITHARRSPEALAGELAARGVFVWHGNYYALEASQALGREPDGMVRIGILHYNTRAEIDRLLQALADLDRAL